MVPSVDKALGQLRAKARVLAEVEKQGLAHNCHFDVALINLHPQFWVYWYTWAFSENLVFDVKLLLWIGLGGVESALQIVLVKHSCQAPVFME